jgi:putative ABC transport system ATP-binding protein
MSSIQTLELHNLSKRYGADAEVFGGVNLQMAAGELVAIMGESGVGKSTLLNIAAGLDVASSGTVALCGRDLGTLKDDDTARLRREKLGFVFQAFHVLPHLTVSQNVALPLLLLGQQSADRVNAALSSVGLSELKERLPAQLSGGQLQRVAIARSLVHKPALILADEPTGNLDPGTADKIMDVLVGQAREQGAAMLLITHSERAAKRSDRVLRLTKTGLNPA